MSQRNALGGIDRIEKGVPRPQVRTTAITELPSQAGSSGKFLTTNGSVVSWDNTGVGVHAATHVTGGGDTIADAIAAGNSGLMSGADKTKLDGVAAGAEVNVNADWNSVAGDSEILNKPATMTPTAHDLGGAAHNADTLANLNLKISDADVPPTTRAISSTGSFTGGGDLSADRVLKLVNDAVAPGANQVYGTSGAGVKGWKADPGGGTVTQGFVIAMAIALG